MCVCFDCYVTRPSKFRIGKDLSIYCKFTIYFRRHNNMIYLLNFNITCIIIFATCFDSYESSSGINFQELLYILFTVFLSYSFFELLQ